MYHRLNEIPLVLPPLSERLDDIPALVEYFLRQFEMVLDDDSHPREINQLGAVLSNRVWEGNVRQLRAEIKWLTEDTDGRIELMVQRALENENKSESEKLLEVLQMTG